jgi:hypothetical protein
VLTCTPSVDGTSSAPARAARSRVTADVKRCLWDQLRGASRFCSFVTSCALTETSCSGGAEQPGEEKRVARSP